MHLPLWFVLLLLLATALPLTTPALIGFGAAWLVSRSKKRTDAARAFKLCTLALLPFWLAGAATGAWWISADMAEHAKWARTHYRVHEATVIDGVDIPAGAEVSRDEGGGPLRAVYLPEGKTLALNGVTWRGELSFASPVDGPRGQISAGTPASDTVIGGIPCRGEKRVDFQLNKQSVEELSWCTLSRDATVDATIEDPAGGSRVQSFSCRGGTEIRMQFGRRGELGRCTLAAPAEVGGVVCADGADLELVNAMLNTCTLAKQARFGPIDLPPGSSVWYITAQPNAFDLPPTGPAVDGFGLSLPPGTRAKFCYRSERLEHLALDQTAYVTVAGLKLTGSVDFDCDPSRSGSLYSGSLFEDAVVGGKQRQRGEVVSRDDLSAK
jgi:hypothetical protein